MHIISKFTTIALLSATAVFCTVGCKKTDKGNATQLTNTDDNGGNASDYARLEQADDDVVSIADAAWFSGSAVPSPFGNCANVSWDSSVIPHRITIDFGSVDCLGPDGYNRRGQIIVYYTKSYNDSGSVHWLHYNNYYFRDQLIDGLDSLVNRGLDSNDNIYYTVSSNDSMNVGGNNGMIKWNSTRTCHWYKGANTVTRNDDVFEITDGSAIVTRGNGHVFSTSVMSPLYVYLDCVWVEQGTLQLTIAGSGTRILDYGDGPLCDNTATYTIGTNVYNITLQ